MMLADEGRWSNPTARNQLPTMRRSLIIAALLVAALVASPAAATPRWMGDLDLRLSFAGRAIDGHYASGLTFTESYLENGRLDYREPNRQMAGRWSIVAGTFCTLYDVSPTGGCYRVRRESDNCYEFYYVAPDENEAASSDTNRGSWTARAWVTDRPSTCRNQPTV
jgi:hypothetical protein